jgi:hypothetical protein
MNSHLSLTRFFAAVLVTGASLSLPACKSHNTTTTVSGAVASFAPDVAAPGANTVALLPGSSSGPNVNVRVTVTGVPTFFGAAFRVKYNPLALRFNGMESTGSFLRAGGVPADHLVFLEDHTSSAGEIIVTATRVDPVAWPPVAVTATSDLVVLNFTALLSVVAAGAEGRLDFGDPKQVCDGTVSAPGCGAVPLASPWPGGGVSAK